MKDQQGFLAGAFLVLAGFFLVPAVIWAGAADEGPVTCEDEYGETRGTYLARCLRHQAPEKLAAELRAELGLKEDLAVRLGEALTRNLEAIERRVSVTAEELQAIEAELFDILKRSPDNDKVLEELGEFYRSWGWSDNLKSPSPAVLGWIESRRDPVHAAIRLSRDVFGPVGVELLMVAASARPDDASPWAGAATAATARDRTWRIRFLEEAFRLASRGKTGELQVPVDLTAGLAWSWLTELLDLGLAQRAVGVVDGLPELVRSRLAQGTPPPDDWHTFRDLRLDLGAAYLLAGRWQEAAWWLQRFEAAPTTLVQDETAAFHGVLARSLRPSPEDPFSLLADVSESRGCTRLAAARFAQREGYPGVAAYLLRQAADSLSRDDAPLEPGRGVSPAMWESVQALRREIEALRSKLESDAEAQEALAVAGQGFDPAAKAIACALRRPVRPAFEEHPLPAGIVPVEPATLADTAEQPRRARAEMALPAGFHAVRVARKGDQMAAIGVSQDYDPLGEVSSGAYWILLSADAGKTWSRPLYTGLRLGQPYVVRQESALPVFAVDGELHVEVEVRELDTSSILFPPVALQEMGLYLVLPLRELRLDSDGDGLTDLAEDRLLIDPRDPDTDGDGLPDGSDSLPGVPLSAEVTPAGRALAAFLASIEGVEQRAILEVCCAGVPVVEEQTEFFVAERPLFAGLSLPRRAVVLTRDEAAAMQEKLGPFYPIEIELFFFDRANRKARLIWSDSWHGEEAELEENDDGTWTAREGRSWFSVNCAGP